VDNQTILPTEMTNLSSRMKFLLLR